jgi:glutathione S-transferase
VPALIRPDGCTLYDSRVITRFLDARADAGLYKERRIWEVLTLEATADGIMDAAVLMVYEGRVRPEEKRYDVWVDAQWSKIEGALDALVARWMSHLAGPIDAGQIAIGCALGYLDFRHGDRDWRTGRAELASWYEAFSQRPSMAATAPAG